MKVLTATGLSHHLEEIIKGAEDSIRIISPYLKINTQILEKITAKAKEGVEVKIVYGKTDLSDPELEKIRDIPNVKIYFNKNLHAKVFNNEKTIIIGSMNLYEFSQINNLELGVVIQREGNEEIFEDALKEVDVIENISILEYSNSGENSTYFDFSDINNIDMYLPFVNRFDEVNFRIVKGRGMSDTRFCHFSASNDDNDYILSNFNGFLTLSAETQDDIDLQTKDLVKK